MPSNAIFHLGLLRNYQVLDRPGTFIVTVAADVTTASLYTEDSYPRYIVPLRVIRGDDLIKLTAVLNAFKEVPFSSVQKYFMSGAIFVNDGIDEEDLPIKGERIIATFEDRDDKLLCTHLKLIDRNALDYVDIAALDAFYKSVSKFLED